MDDCRGHNRCQRSGKNAIETPTDEGFKKYEKRASVRVGEDYKLDLSLLGKFIRFLKDAKIRRIMRNKKRKKDAIN